VAFGRDAIPGYAIGDGTYLGSVGAEFLESWRNLDHLPAVRADEPGIGGQ
jgi:hypothetical protein